MTAELLVIVPSRGRPSNIVELLDAWTATGAQADLCVAVDEDDPTLLELVESVVGREFPFAFVVQDGPRLGMIGTLNQRAVEQAGRYPFVGFMGDDHRPRSQGWDRAVVGAIDELGAGIVYGNDLFQGEALPTAVFMASEIVTSLGFMVPPVLQHMYADNYWRDLGLRLGALRYLPNIVIEHVHPHAGKAETDAGYQRVWPLMERDRAAYESYVAEGGLDRDAERIRGSAAVR